MMSLTDLPLSFWGYALETAAFTLNRAPSKSVETTPFELWFGKKPKLSFLKVWGCDAYVKKLQPEKLEPIKLFSVAFLTSIAFDFTTFLLFLGTSIFFLPLKY